MLEKISLHNFRNLNLEENLLTGNLLIASNGSGKTNFLESIYYLCFGKPFRPYSQISEVIGPRDEFARVQVIAEEAEIEMVTTQLPNRVQRKLSINDKPKRLTEVRKYLPVILFAPHAVNLVSDEPSLRRHDLDDFLSTVSASYANNISHYDKVLQNRNALLKHLRDFPQTGSELEFWTQQLVDSAAAIVASRQEMFAEIKQLSSQAAAEIYHKDFAEFAINYHPFRTNSADYKSELAELFRQNMQKEIIVGQTLYGPHKDDYTLEVDGKNLRYIGSRGEQRIAVLIWKMCQALYIHQTTGKHPLLLIDDLMSELDTQHRQSASDYLLNRPNQFIITAADVNDVPTSLQTATNNIVISG